MLDDALSSVDTDTEERILRGLSETLIKRRTTILMSHRCSTVRDADQIVVLRDGRIVERGTHAELLGSVATTTISIRSNCWKRSSSGNERHPRRRSARKNIRLAPDGGSSMLYLRPYKWWVFFALALALAVAPMEIVGPYFFKIAIDNDITPVLQHQLAFSVALRSLEWITFGFLGALILSFALQYLQMRVMQRVGQDIMYDLRREIFVHLQRLPLSFYDRSPVGGCDARDHRRGRAERSLRFRRRRHTQRFLRAAVSRRRAAALRREAGACYSLAASAHVDHHAHFPHAGARRQSPHSHGHRAYQRVLAGAHQRACPWCSFSIVSENRGGEFEKLNRVHMDAYKDAINAFAYFYPAVEFLSIAAIALVFWYGGVRVIKGTLDAGLLVAFMMWAQRFFRPIQDLSDKFNILQTAMAASSASSSCSMSRSRPSKLQRRAPFIRRAAKSSSAMSGLPTAAALLRKTMIGCSATFRSAFCPARLWRSSAIPARARLR